VGGWRLQADRFSATATKTKDRRKALSLFRLCEKLVGGREPAHGADMTDHTGMGPSSELISGHACIVQIALLHVPPLRLSSFQTHRSVACRPQRQHFISMPMIARPRC